MGMFNGRECSLNRGDSATKPFKPWRLEMSTDFNQENVAMMADLLERGVLGLIEDFEKLTESEESAG